jgi:signal transduction histidine kinase
MALHPRLVRISAIKRAANSIVPSFNISQVRSLRTAAVKDEDISRLASKPMHPLALQDLVKHGWPPLTAQQLFNSAKFTLAILPSRLARRIQALRNLPFIVVTNPQISRIHGNYMHSLSTLLPWAEKDIDNLEDEIKFTEVMADLVQTHTDTISVLARGFLESRKYISPKEVTAFLDEHLRARIGTRLIAEQHTALHFSSQPHLEHVQGDESRVKTDPDDHPSYIGVIDTELHPASIIRNCETIVGDICEFKYGVRPQVIINGEPQYAFAQIPVHLEYILTELLKNAFRATIENRMEREPIEVTIAPLPESSKATEVPHVEQQQSKVQGMPIDDLAKTMSTAPIAPMAQSSPGVTIRIRDRGGGIAPTDYARIWDYSFTTFNEEQINSTLSPDGADSPHNAMDGFNAISSPGGSSLAGLGYGLPLSRAYAEYFGGGIAVQSLWGWGTDVYLSLRGVGRVDNG